MLILYIAFLLLALAGLLALGGSKVLCVLLLAGAAAGGVLSVLPRRKLRGCALLLLPVCLALGLLAGRSALPDGEYGDRMAQIKAELDRSNLDWAMELLDDLDEDFGVTDLSLYARTEILLAVEDYGGALSCLNQVRDQSDGYWYEYLERLYNLEGSEASLAKLRPLYLEAAQEAPENGHMQYMAGLVKLEEGAYGSAAYYLQRAMELEEDDPLPCYYLGALCYDQGRRQEAAAYFNEALRRGADEEKTACIQWYLSGEDETDEE